MPNVTYLGETYPCAKALKGPDYIHLLDSDGVLIVAFDGIKDFTGFTIDTDWTIPPPNDDCYLAVIGEDGIIRKGTHKCCDIPFTDTEEIDIDEEPTKDSPNLITSGAVYKYMQGMCDIEWNSVPCSEMCSSALFDEGDYEIRYQGFTFPVFHVKNSDTYAEYSISATNYVFATGYVQQHFCQLTFLADGQLKSSGCYTSYIQFTSEGTIALGEQTLLTDTSNKLYYRKIR